MEAVLPLYYWPPLSWLQAATQLRVFSVGYPPRLPPGSLYYRCYLPQHGWLSVPLRRESRKTPWQATWPPHSDWKMYHFKVLQTLYGKAPFFLEWKPFLEEIYLTSSYQTLGEITWRIIAEIALWHGWRVSLWRKGSPPLMSLEFEAGISSLDLLLRIGLSPGDL